MYNLILDTNVLIDALSDYQSPTWQILNMIKSADVKFFASYKILKEYQLIIDRQVVKEKDKQILQKFISQVEAVNVRNQVKAVKWDPEDDKFINAALSAKAQYIISSDSHLLELGEYGNIKILSPKDFLFLYKGQKDESGKQEWADIFSNIFK